MRFPGINVPVHTGKHFKAGMLAAAKEDCKKCGVYLIRVEINRALAIAARFEDYPKRDAESVHSGKTSNENWSHPGYAASWRSVHFW